MHKIAVVDPNEKFSSFAVFSESFQGVALENTGQVNGNFLDKGETAAKLKGELERLCPEGFSLILLIPRHLGLVTSVEIPAKSPDIIGKMMEFEFPRHFPLKKEELIADYYIASRNEDSFEINLAGVKREDFEKWMNLSNNAGLYPDGVSLSSAASLPVPTGYANGIPGGAEMPSKRVFISISAEGFELSMVNKKRIMYSRFTRFKPPIDEKYFFSEEPWDDSSATSAAKQVQEEFQRVRLVSGIEGIDDYLQRIFISGGGMLRGKIAYKLGGIPEFAKSDITKLPGNDSKSGFDYTAVAQGMLGIDEGVRFNLIPKKQRRSMFDRLRKRLLLTGGVLGTALLIWISTAWGIQYYRITTLETELARLRSEATKSEKMLLKVDEIVTYLGSFINFAKSPALTIGVFDAINSALPMNTHLTDIDLRRGKLTIAGLSGDSSSLIKMLENSAAFKNVRMVGAVNTAVGGVEKFKIAMELE